MSVEKRVIAGALFDFAGFLTTRPERIQIGSSADAAPIVEMLKEWADARRLSLDSAYVCDWRKAIEQAEKQKPVGYWNGKETAWFEHETLGSIDDCTIPLYTAPPQREWVGLTVEDKDTIWYMVSCGLDYIPVSRADDLFYATEAKLKEKNHELS